MADQENRILIVGTSCHANTVNSVTYNGDSLTQVPGVSKLQQGAVAIDMWYMLQPDVGASQTVQVNFAGGTRNVCGAMSFYNANQSTPFGTPLSDVDSIGPCSVTLTSAANEICVLVGGAEPHNSQDGTLGAGVSEGWTNYYNPGNNPRIKGYGGRKTGETNCVMAIDHPVNQNMCMWAIPIKEFELALGGKRNVFIF